MTVDLPEEQHAFLKRYVARSGSDGGRVIRALLRHLESDDELSEAVMRELADERMRELSDQQTVEGIEDAVEGNTLIEIVKGSDNVRWDYDKNSDVLYLSLGEPVYFLTTDIGGGILVRHDEESKQIVGLTITGLGSRLLEIQAGSGKT